MENIVSDLWNFYPICENAKIMHILMVLGVQTALELVLIENHYS